MKKYYKPLIIIAVILAVMNIIQYKSYINLAEEYGSSISFNNDIALVIIPREIISIVKSDDYTDSQLIRMYERVRFSVISYKDFEEIDNYLLNIQDDFRDFKRANEENNDAEIIKAKKELIATCELGLKLNDEIYSYFDLYRTNKMGRKEHITLYKAKNREGHEIRKLMRDVLKDRAIYE